MKSIVILLNKDEKIRKIREKYLDKRTEPHITLVYPFDGISNLNEHIKKAIKEIPPFTIELSGLQESAKENYLYLLVNRGQDKIMELYRKLHTRELSDHSNPDIPQYIPHLSLGKFESEERLEGTRKKIDKENLNHKEKVECIQLLELKKDKIKNIKNFSLER